MNAQDIQALIEIVKWFMGATVLIIVGCSVTYPLFNYMVKKHEKLMREVIPSYFEEDEP